MNRKTIAILATVLGAGLMTLAACSSDEATSTGGPSNTPPNTNPPAADGGNTNPDSGNTNPDGGEPEVCTGSTFDNTRIPGWPNVPTP